VSNAVLQAYQTVLCKKTVALELHEERAFGNYDGSQNTYLYTARNCCLLLTLVTVYTSINMKPH